LPLFLFFAFTSSQYLQVGAVSIVSLLTYSAVTEETATTVAKVAQLNSAMSSAVKAAKALPSSNALAILSVRATTAFNAADSARIQQQVQVASLLAFYVGIFSFGIGFLKLGNIMNLMSAPVISGFQSAAAITIGMGQLKNTFGYGKDFTSSNKLDEQIQSFIDWRGELNTRTTWSGWLWIAILMVFKYVGRLKVKVRGVEVFRFFKIMGPVLLVIISILSTYYGELYLSPGCKGYDSVKNSANLYVPTAVGIPSAWNVSSPGVTTTNFVGALITYNRPVDNPGCVPFPKLATVVTYLPDTTNPWGSLANPWPRVRGLAITGTFGAPPHGIPLNHDLVSGTLLTSAIVITLVASLESIAISRALANKHKQTGFEPSKEYIALVRPPSPSRNDRSLPHTRAADSGPSQGMANFFGSMTGAYPISGSFSRSALNEEVGATSPVAVLTVATLVGIVIKIASSAPIFFYLPQNALSAIVVVSLMNLLDVDHFLYLLKNDRKDAGLWLTAFLAVLFQGVEIGILIAVCISLALVVVETIMSPMPELGLVPGNSRRAYRSIRQYPDAKPVHGVRIFRVESPICFFNAESVASTLRAVVFGSDATSKDKLDGLTTRSLVVDMSNVPYVDSTMVGVFSELLEQLEHAGVLLVLANPNSAVLHRLTQSPLLKLINGQFGVTADHVYLTVSEAVDAAAAFQPPIKTVKIIEDSEPESKPLSTVDESTAPEVELAASAVDLAASA
jgi:MFS superfamily sulfate permease-like transporter